MKQPAELIVRTHYIDNGKGWELELRQCYDPRHLNKTLRPLMIVPGYGMNAFIFSFHPTGQSMEAAWAEAGFDVWSVNLRGQGGSRRLGGARNYDLADVVLQDLPAAVNAVLANTASERKDAVDGVGASLGGTFLYAYLALAEEPKIGSVVAIGAPLRWEKIIPALKAAFSLPEVVGRIPFRGTQRLARLLFPVILKAPFLLRVYLHPELVDMNSLTELTRSIEDPVPGVNRQIAYWMRHKDLVLRGRNVTERLADRKNPLLCVVASSDGIVPRKTALSGYYAMGGDAKDILEVGNKKRPYAHADLFISKYADEQVFKPIAAWLLKQYGDKSNRKGKS